MTKEKIKDLIAKMTLEEKAAMCSGADFWHTESCERLEIPASMVSDGPHGLRKQAGAGDHLGLNASIPATCFPTAATMANSWDEALGEEMGRALGEEAAANDVNVLLGPGLNMKRSPLCGRNFEYFSEDPYLAGKMAAAYVRGIQANGVSACPKHFACNNQETMRIYNDSRVSERALREIYLKGFEICVKTAHPFNIMTSYNKINGVWGHYHYGTCTQILRGEWEYDGCVMTDWWMRASKDPDFPLLRNNAYRVRGQVDVLMPGAGAGSRKVKYDPTLLESLGKPDGITRAEIFRSAMNTLRFVLRSHPFCVEHGLDNGYRPGPDWFECR